jgi:hypothetical protein
MDIVIKNFWTYPPDTTTQKDITILFAKPDGGGGFSIRQQTKEDFFKINSAMSLVFVPAGPTTLIVFDANAGTKLDYETVTGVLSFVGLNAIDIADNTVLQFNETSGEVMNFNSLDDAKINYLAGARFMWLENFGSLVMSSNFATADIEMQNAASFCRLKLGGSNADTGQKVGEIVLYDTANNESRISVDITEDDQDIEVDFKEPRNEYDVLSDDPLSVSYREDDQFRFTDNPSNADVITAQSAHHSVEVIRIVAPIANLTLDLPAAKNGDIVDFSVFGSPATNITMTAAGGATIDSPLSGTASRHIRTWIYDEGFNAWFRFSA